VSDDKPILTVTAPDATATEAGLTPGTFRFARTGSTTAPLTVTYTIGGTATPGTDYISLGSSVTFPANTATVTKAVSPLQDTLQELNETIILTLTPISTYLVGSSSTATITLTSDETVTKVVTVTALDASATEAGLTSGTFRFARTGSTASALTVYYTVTGTATAGTDYTALGTSVTFPAGQSTVTKPVTPRQDSLQELNETVILTLTQHATYAVGSSASATVTLTSDDLPTVTVTATDATAGEGGSDRGVFTVTRTGPTTASLTVYYTRTGGATAGSDYLNNFLATSVTIPAGQPKVTLTVTPIDDASEEGSEAVVLTLVPNAAYTVGTPRTATVTIADNDERP
jgi:hypothetical protein